MMKTNPLLGLVVLAMGLLALVGACGVGEEEVLPPTSQPTIEPAKTPLPLTPTPFVTSTLAPDATLVGVLTPPGVTSEPTSASPSPAPFSAPSTLTVSPPAVTPSPRVGPIKSAEPHQLRTDKAGKYYIPDRGDGCTWTQRLALTPLEGGDSPIIVLYSDCEAKFYFAYYVNRHLIGNVPKPPVYQPWPLMPVDIGLGSDGYYYVPDRGDGCEYREIARPPVGGQEWVVLDSELCYHALWRFSPTTGELFAMDPRWWPDRSVPSQSDIQMGSDGRYFVRDRGDGCIWVESGRSEALPNYVYFTTDCGFIVLYAYDTATGEFVPLGVP